MKKLKQALQLFISFFKIGLFTFGGGYAMIAIMEREFIERKQWLGNDEFTDLIAVAESTPGPIAVNSATFIGYKKAGVLGSAFATLGVVLPSFIIIYCISLFFDAFIANKWVAYAFNGIQAVVPLIILTAGIKMLKKTKKSVFNTVIFILTFAVLTALNVFAVKFSTVFLILIGGLIGLAFFGIKDLKNKDKKYVKGDR